MWDIECHHTRIGRYQSCSRACSRPTVSLVCSEAIQNTPLFSWQTESWRTNIGGLDWVTVEHRSRTPIIVPLRNDVDWLAPYQTIEACTMLADVEVDEWSHYWWAMHAKHLLWPLVCPLLLCALKQVVQCGLKQ